MDFTQAWLPYLEALSLLDGQPLKDLQRLADSAKVLRPGTGASPLVPAQYLQALASSADVPYFRYGPLLQINPWIHAPK